MVVQHNLTAMNSNRMLGITTKTQAKSTEKLSSGYKINRAADDAAGLAISEKMRKQIRGLTQASLNAQDGISAVQTAEGALTEVHDMLQRMNELAVKAANGTNSEDDRSYIQDEIDALVAEIDRVSTTTKFNETYLLKGDEGTENAYSYKAAEGVQVKTTKVVYNAAGEEIAAGTVLGDVESADDAATKYYSGKQGKAGSVITNPGDGQNATGTPLTDYIEIDGTDTTKVKYKDNAPGKLYDANGDEIDLDTFFKVNGGVLMQWQGTDDVYTDIEGTGALATTDFEEEAAEEIALYDKDGAKISADALADLFDDDGNLKADAEVYADADGNTQVDATTIDNFVKKTPKPAALTLTLHVGADYTTDNQISVKIDSMSAMGIGLIEEEGGKLLVNGEDDTNALAAIKTIDAAIKQVSKQRSALGAVQNRLEHTINNLDNVVENTTSAESQIRDTDMATEMVRYSNNNILAQAGQAMLAQANQANQGVLSLLG